MLTTYVCTSSTSLTKAFTLKFCKVPVAFQCTRVTIIIWPQLSECKRVLNSLAHRKINKGQNNNSYNTNYLMDSSVFEIRGEYICVAMYTQTHARCIYVYIYIYIYIYIHHGTPLIYDFIICT